VANGFSCVTAFETYAAPGEAWLPTTRTDAVEVFLRTMAPALAHPAMPSCNEARSREVQFETAILSIGVPGS
jgi:hypothetical protein